MYTEAQKVESERRITEILKQFPDMSDEDRSTWLFVVLGSVIDCNGSVTPCAQKLVDQYIAYYPDAKAGIESFVVSRTLPPAQ